MISAPDSERFCEIARSATAHLQAEAVFVSGSLVEGFGNENSDLDVFVLTSSTSDASLSETASTFDMGDCLIEVDYHHDVRVDTEIWPIERFFEIAGRISDFPVGDASAIIRFPDRDFDSAHRLRIGVPVRGVEVFNELRDKFDFKRLSRLLANKFVTAYEGHSEDASGAVRANDAYTAMLMSRWALGSAIDAYLASQGMTNPKEKWRFSKLVSGGHTDLAQRYLELEADLSVSPEDVLTRSRDRLRFSASLVHELHQSSL
ncbi:nucleotidyltransferase domain-containing protein [Streptomyces sp. NPDC058255]|uniref:nucleotidyltransferase domain-containing protein n=1 Tax=Streptomyces sp. NPDC058255 TaxID=3346407 RepID=UPI0036EC6054